MRRRIGFDRKLTFMVVWITATFMAVPGWIVQNSPNIKMDSLEKTIAQYMDWYGLPGLAIGLAKDGQIVYAKGFGLKCMQGNERVAKNTIFSTASVTKLFVSIAVMKLYEEGKIDLGESISKYLPYFELGGGLHKKITVTQLLNHTSGLPDETGDEFNSSWKSPEYDDGALKRYVKGLRTIKPVSPPGEKYRYSNIGYEILGCMVAEISGMTLEAYINKNILEPIGMHQSSMLLNNIDKNLLACPHVLDGALKFKRNEFFPYTRRHAASGTLLSNVEDMCRFAVAILNKGTIGGRRILRESSLKKVLTPENGNPAGLSWHVEKVDSGATLVFHTGGDPGFRTELILIPGKAMGVVVMTNSWEHQIEPLAYKALNMLGGDQETDWFTFYHGSTWKIFRENNILDAVDKIRKLAAKDGLANFHPAILNQHGTLLWDLGRKTDAIHIKKLNIEFYPKNFQLHNILAESYAALGDTRKAIIYFEKSIELKPQDNIAVERLKQLR